MQVIPVGWRIHTFCAAVAILATLLGCDKPGTPERGETAKALQLTRIVTNHNRVELTNCVAGTDSEWIALVPSWSAVGDRQCNMGLVLVVHTPHALQFSPNKPTAVAILDGQQVQLWSDTERLAQKNWIDHGSSHSETRLLYSVSAAFLRKIATAQSAEFMVTAENAGVRVRLPKEQLACIGDWIATLGEKLSLPRIVVDSSNP